MHYPTSPSQYSRQHRKGVFGQCAALTSPSGYPIQNATGHDFTLTPAKGILVQKTESLSPNQLTSKLPFHTQVLEFTANCFFSSWYDYHSNLLGSFQIIAEGLSPQ